MKTFTRGQVDLALFGNPALDGADIRTDNQGQIVIYTRIFRWDDGTYHDEPDPDYNVDGFI